MQKEHELTLLNVKGEQTAKIAEYDRKLKHLEQEVEKYRILAGIESLTLGLGEDVSAQQSAPEKHTSPSPHQSPQEKVGHRSCFTL